MHVNFRKKDNYINAGDRSWFPGRTIRLCEPGNQNYILIRCVFIGFYEGNSRNNAQREEEKVSG